MSARKTCISTASTFQSRRCAHFFLSYVDTANSLNETPQYYNTITANCTTIVFAMINHIVSGALPLDYRLIFSGYLPSYIIDVNGFTPGFTLEQLQSGGAISARAQAADNTPDFSRRIREGVPRHNPFAATVKPLTLRRRTTGKFPMNLKEFANRLELSQTTVSRAVKRLSRG